MKNKKTKNKINVTTYSSGIYLMFKFLFEKIATYVGNKINNGFHPVEFSVFVLFLLVLGFCWGIIISVLVVLLTG